MNTFDGVKFKFICVAREATDLQSGQEACLARGEFPFLTCCGSRSGHLKDTAFNVCLQVGNVASVTLKVRDCSQDHAVILEPTSVSAGKFPWQPRRLCSVVENAV